MKLITILGTAAVFAANVQGASLITGWDFSNFFTGNESWTVQGGPFVNQNNIVSLYSDLTGDGAANSNGNVQYLGGAANTTKAGQNLTVGTDIVTRPLGPEFGSNPTGSSGVNFGLRVNTAGQLLFSTSTQGTFFDFTDGASTVQFAATVAGASNATISWEYSVNGVDFFSTGDIHSVNNTLGSGGSLYTIDLDGFGGSYNGNIFLRGTYSGVSVGNELIIDNFQVNGESVVPEPSTYAMIAGFAALGLAYLRRRKA